ncbi:MAG TPA: uracil-DNA glycosylase [Candidatus Acidoferrum sp.]|nr:uracil-DNA glycosylase [Candidatus Acidoferrum sp.]
MDPEKRARVEAWLQFGEELGLGPFYRDRSRAAQDPEARDGAAESAAPELPARIGFPASSAAASFSKPAPPSTPDPAPSRTSVGFSPAASSPNLFEAAERVEGDTLEQIRTDIGDCTRCRLHKARHNIVFGVGSPTAQLVFVGEGPGHDEDMQGEPFVGRAGKLLTQMIEAMGLKREDVYICNVVKCRPPENRLPERDEIATCSPFLLRQLEVIRPKVICCLGACSAQTLLATNQGISKFRGEWFDFRGAKLIATYHPAYLLRNPNAKGEVWKDLQKVMAVLGLQPRKR